MYRFYRVEGLGFSGLLGFTGLRGLVETGPQGSRSTMRLPIEGLYGPQVYFPFGDGA